MIPMQDYNRVINGLRTQLQIFQAHEVRLLEKIKRLHIEADEAAQKHNVQYNDLWQQIGKLSDQLTACMFGARGELLIEDASHSWSTAYDDVKKLRLDYDRSQCSRCALVLAPGWWLIEMGVTMKPTGTALSP